MADVAVLGMGRMGAAMAHKLVAAGHRVTVWNRTRAAADLVAGECVVKVASTPADAVAGASLVISILASGPVTRQVLLDPTVLAALRPGAVVCDMGTSGVDVAHELASVLAAAGARFVDAPVSGSVPTIVAGQLLVMASGDASGIVEAEPILGSFAKRVAHLGDAGAGQAMKLAVNLIVFTLNSAVSEALALATSAGLAAKDVYDIFEDSVIAAPLVKYKRSAFLDPQAPVAMSLTLTRKDLGLITAFAEAQGVPTSVADAVRDEVVRACDAGYAEHDMAALVHFLADAQQG